MKIKKKNKRKERSITSPIWKDVDLNRSNYYNDNNIYFFVVHLGCGFAPPFSIVFLFFMQICIDQKFVSFLYELYSTAVVEIYLLFKK